MVDEEELPRSLYRVRYQLAIYSGTKDVWAVDDEHACALVRSWARKQTSLTMYSESYRVVEILQEALGS